MRGRRALLTFTVLAAACLLHAACGGATQSDLFNGSSNGADDASVAVIDSAADAKPDTTVIDARPDGAIDATPDVPPPPPDAPPDVPLPPTTIYCVNATCVSGTDSCCVEIKNGTTKGECKPLGKCGGGKVALSCDTDDDCLSVRKDTVCCVSFNEGSGIATGASCYEAKDCASKYSRTRPCDPNSKVNVCEAGDVCRVSTNTLPGYYLCLPP